MARTCPRSGTGPGATRHDRSGGSGHRGTCPTDSMRITRWPSHLTTPGLAAQTSNTISGDATSVTLDSFIMLAAAAALVPWPRRPARETAGAPVAGMPAADGQDRATGFGIPGWSIKRLWDLSFLLCLAVAALDAATGPHLILIGALIAGPCCALLTGRWIRMVLTGVFALSLGVLLGVPDGSSAPMCSTRSSPRSPSSPSPRRLAPPGCKAARRSQAPGSPGQAGSGGQGKLTGHAPSGSGRGRQKAAPPAWPPRTVPRGGALGRCSSQAAGLRWSRSTCSVVSGRCQNSQARRPCPSSRAGGGGGMARAGHRAWARQYRLTPEKAIRVSVPRRPAPTTSRSSGRSARFTSTQPAGPRSTCGCTSGSPGTSPRQR